MESDNALAKIAYDAAACSLDANGGPAMPPFEKLSEREQASWRSAASAVESETKAAIRRARGVRDPSVFG
jgi:hypothetical protein